MPNVPFNSKAGDSWLLCKNISSDLLKNRLCRGISVELIRIIFIVDIVSDSYELPVVVGTGEKNNGDSKDFSIWDTTGIGWIGLEDELVDTNRDRTDEERVEFLIMLIASIVSYIVVL